MEHDFLSGLGFATKAEAARQTGNLEEAKRIAYDGLKIEPSSLAGQIVLARVLSDLDLADEAQMHLEAALAMLPGFDAALLSERHSSAANAAPQEMLAGMTPQDEGMADAFFVAATEPESTTDDNLFATGEQSDFSAHEMELSEVAEILEDVEEEVDELRKPFATDTVARLLEAQGHLDAAQEIRAVISQKKPTATKTQDEDLSSRDKIVATLEQWLQNLRGGVQ